MIVLLIMKSMEDQWMQSKERSPKKKSQNEPTTGSKEFSDSEIKELKERADKVAQQFLDSLNRSTFKI